MTAPTITIFSIPKGFTDPHIARIQRNAIASWKAIPGAEVFLVGNDPGVAETAHEFGVTHVPDVAVSEYGTPLLNSAFDIVHERAQAQWVMYVNGDIIFAPDFVDVLLRLPPGPLLAVGQRTDFDLAPEEEALSAEGRARIFDRAQHDGRLHSVQGIDYFLFRKGMYPKIPPFAIGRGAFDCWLLRAARKAPMKLIDLTKVVTIIHQNHPENQGTGGTIGKKSPEALTRNLTYMKDKTWYYTIADANWCLTPAGLRFNYQYKMPLFKRWAKMILRR